MIDFDAAVNVTLGLPHVRTSPDHGTAFGIAGQGVANPVAAILSFEMALRWSLERPDLADRLYGAVKAALDKGARTRDLGGKLSTEEMGAAILAQL